MRPQKLPWLNVLLMVTMVGNMVMPLQLAVASSTENSSTLLADNPFVTTNPSKEVGLKTPHFSPLTQVFNEVLIPYGAAGYKYALYNNQEPPSATSQPGFDDSGFATGQAAFSSGGGCGYDNTRQTHWPNFAWSYIAVRKEFAAPAGFKLTNLRVKVAIDNDVRVFINGQAISGNDWNYNEGCAQLPDYTFTAPDEILNEGANLLAVWGRERTGISYLNVEVVADLTPIDTLSTPKPSPGMSVPSAATASDNTTSAGQ